MEPKEDYLDYVTPNITDFQAPFCSKHVAIIP